MEKLLKDAAVSVSECLLALLLQGLCGGPSAPKAIRRGQGPNWEGESFIWPALPSHHVFYMRTDKSCRCSAASEAGRQRASTCFSLEAWVVTFCNR